MDEHRLRAETYKYVERVQESLGLTLSLEEWNRTVEKIYDEMKFLIKHPSAGGKP